ncbi:MAG: hypothetical protein KJ727_10945 [Acidobacteria bacterium]|nr:hypothetical protein [Acidobacteriota bacterium]MBU4330666.1 hypothetical protein [Acidobacteriota bacterium]MCG2816710.1 hypothetical protein [Candidatus Aminicenantes bacterium]
MQKACILVLVLVLMTVLTIDAASVVNDSAIWKEFVQLLKTDALTAERIKHPASINDVTCDKE